METGGNRTRPHEGDELAASEVPIARTVRRDPFLAITRVTFQSTLKNEQGISGPRKVSGLDGPSTYSGCWIANASTLWSSTEPSFAASNVVVRILGRRACSAAVTSEVTMPIMAFVPNTEGMVVRTWSFPPSRQM